VKHLLIILSSLFCAILFIVIFCIETATAREPFIISSESLERIPPKHLNFLEGFDLYQNQRFEEALPLFSQCLEIVAEDTVATLYVERCEILISGGWNTETWDGVNRMETK